MTTAEELAAITDRGKFEILANAILRESDSNYRALTAPGVNAAGEPVKSPVDAYCWIPGAGPPHLIVVAHTTTEAKRLREKWFGGSGSGRSQRQSNGTTGDLPKIAEQVAAARANAPEAECTIVLTSNERVPTPLQDSVQAFAREHKSSADIWDQARLSDFLDHTFAGRGLRRRLLNMSERAAFVTAEEFFKPWLDGKQLFNHTWLLQGREQIVEAVRSFLQSEDKSVFILPGRGGIGKSRLLREFVDTAKAARLGLKECFLMTGISVTPDDFFDLPDSPVLVIVDDAHQRDDLPVFLARAIRHAKPVKIIFACRPYGIEPLKGMIYDAGYPLDAVFTETALSPLSEADTEHLVQLVLGADYPHLVRPILRATKDCPLMTTLAAKLVADRQIPATRVTNEPEFRANVLKHFRDALLGRLGDEVSQERARMLLPVIAAASPIPTTTDAFRNRAATFLQWQPDEVVRCLDQLRMAGVLVQRGDALRIAPDVLSDEFLENQCLDRQGMPTGFASRIYNEFGEAFGPNLLRNLAQLDWRTRYQRKTESGLLDDVWGRIVMDFRAATNAARLDMLGLLKHIAHYLPMQMLELVEVAIANPSKEPDEIGQRMGYELNHENVLAQLPDMLERIGHTIDCLPRCCELLWSLARDSGPPTARTRNPAVDALTAVAKYKVYPDGHIYLQRNETILERATTWASNLRDDSDAILLVTVLENLLVSSDQTEYFDGQSIVVFPFVVPLNETVAIRQGVLVILKKASVGTSEVARFRIIQALAVGISPPQSTYHHVLTPDQVIAWTPERLKVLAALDALVDSELSPIVQMQVADELQWYAGHDIDSTIRVRSTEIRNRIQDTDELDVVTNLTRAYDPGWSPPDGIDHALAFEEHDREMAARREASAARFRSNATSAAIEAARLGQYLYRIKLCGVRPDPQPFLAELSAHDPGFAADIADSALAVPDHPLYAYVRPLISSLWSADPNRAIAICGRAIRSGNPTLACPMGQAISVVQLPPEHNASREGLIRELIASQSDGERACGIAAMDNLKGSSTSEGIETVLAVDFGDGQGIAEAVCRFAVRRYPHLAVAEIDRLLACLETVPDIGNADVGRFIALASHKRPRSVFGLLVRRIQSERNLGYGIYQPVPDAGVRFRLAGLLESSERLGMLRDVRDLALDAPWAARKEYPTLFRLLSGDYGRSSIDVLNEWSDIRDCSKLNTIANLLTAAPSAIVFRESVLIGNLLETANVVSGDCLRDVRYDLVDAAMGRSRSGTAGQPYPEDIAIRERAVVALESVERGSAAYDYYDDLRQRAERNIREADRRRDIDEE